MPRLMYDSVNPFAIPETAQMVLVYVDGIYAWSKAGRDRFKHAKQVTCSAIGAVVAQVGDVELGCIWPVANAVPYVRRQRAAGLVGCIYINQENDWGPCREAFWRAGEPEPLWLVANYDGVPEIPAGSIGKQYAHSSVPPGNPTGPWHTKGHYDVSLVVDHWPGVDTGPGGGGGLEDPLAGITIQQIEDAAFRSHHTFWRGMAAGTDHETHEAFKKVMLDFVVGPAVDRLSKKIDETGGRPVPVQMTKEDRDAIVAELAPAVANLLAERLRD